MTPEAPRDGANPERGPNRPAGASLDDIERVAHIGSWEWNIREDSVSWSRELARIFERDPDDVEFRYSDYLDRVHPLDRERIEQIIGSALERRERFAFEHRLVTRDGALHILSCHGEVECDGDGEPIRMLGTAQDVTELRESQWRLAEAQRIAGVGSWEWDPSSDAMWWSDELHAITGIGHEDFPGTLTAMRAAVHEGDRELLDRTISTAVEERDRFELDLRLLGPGGERRVHGYGEVVVDEQGKATRLRGTLQDITELQAHRRQAEQLAERNRAILDAAGEGIVGLDADGLIVFANPAASRMLERPAEELRGAHWTRALYGSERAAAPAGSQLAAGIRRGFSHGDDDEAFQRKDGSTFPVEYFIAPIVEERQIGGAVLTFRDVSERKRYEERLRYLAERDPLSGLLNRRRFETALEDHLALAERRHQPGALLMVDLDHFKDVNDTLGHRAGDEVIRTTAKLLVDRVRTTDLLARLGGDEFAVLLTDTEPEEAERVAEEILELLRDAEILTGGRRAEVTASVGLAPYSGEEEISADSLLIDADLAMYRAKDEGRNRLVVASGEDTVHPGRISLTERLRSAFESDGFRLWAQPIHELASGRVSQIELLLRLEGEAGELVPPGGFIPAAERYGLVGGIDRWVLERAVETAASVSSKLLVHVNISSRSIGDESLYDRLGEWIEREGADPGRLVIEVTETSAIENVGQVKVLARRLRELGCRIALDDFGSGFGSFYYLKHLPFDFLKIDGDFIREVSHNEIDQLVVKAVVEMAKGMGKATIAEFVGDTETEELLCEIGVDYVQGYGPGAPEPLEDILRTIADQHAEA